MNKYGKLFTLFIILCLSAVMLSSISVSAASSKEVSEAINETAASLLETIKDPQVGSVGGEWAIIGLARSGYPVPQSYYDAYYRTVEKYVKENNGILSDKKYTEYARLILAVKAIGGDPANVAGYNLLEPLGDFDRTIWQGINGPIFAMIALDSGNYSIPYNSAATTHATRDRYIDEILSRQLKDGGFALSGSAADPDITGMALQALAKYQDRTNVKAATDKAIHLLSTLQNSDGGYASWGVNNSESTVQVLMALCELGIPMDDSRFVKNGNTVADNLLSYFIKGQGFRHAEDGSGVNGMSTEQALYGLVNAQRAAAGQNSLYRMGDAAGLISVHAPDAAGLPTKHKDVQAMPVTDPGKTFKDIAKHPNEAAIEALASRMIIDGLAPDAFAPDRTMTRAEFAAIVIKGLGLAPKATEQFADVPAASWYAGYVGTAYTYGIVKGTSAATFTPGKTITRQEAAVMIANAAKLCGLDTAMSAGETRDMLAQFGDYTQTAAWARTALAFNYKANILSQEALNIAPAASVTRAEIAEMLYRMLLAAKLL